MATLLIGCSGDDSSGSTDSAIQINPPSWIRGKWLVPDAPFPVGFRFTNNDFIIVQAGAEISQRDQLNDLIDSGATASASDESSDQTYSIGLSYPAGQTVFYSFTKVDSQTIIYDELDVEYVKQ